MEARIVVVDNDDDMRELFNLCLNDAGWEVFSYDYAHIKLSSLKQLHPDLIILDFNKVDGGTGWEFLQLLKMDDTTAKIPILVVTASSPLSLEVQGYLLARYIQVVKKPFELDAFDSIVRKSLTLARQTTTLFSSDRPLPILVVEDAESLRETLATLLMFEGHQVVTVENGLLALEALYHAEYCLILLDLSMPIMDGYEFLRAYDRQLRPHVPVIILSGEQVLTIRPLPSFVVDTLSKPFEISHLVALVGKYAQPV